MEKETLSPLLTYGPLGIFCVILLFVVWKLYRDLMAERDAHKKTVEDWNARHTQKAETWMEKYHELASSQDQVLQSIAKRYERDRR